MPVIFKTPLSQQIMMLDKDAEFMLKAMKTSGNIPGAMYAEDVKEALNALESRLEIETNDNESDSEADEDQHYVSVNTKALPLIKLLQDAIEQGETLMWDRG